MGAFDWLFGKPQTPTVTQNSTSTFQLGPEQQAMFGQAMPFLMKYATNPLSLYGGSGIAGLTPDQLHAQDLARTAAGGNVQALADTAAATNKQLMDPGFMLDMNNKPLTDARDAITGQVTRNLNEHILPGIRTGATQTGGMYSGGTNREGIAQAGAIGKTNQDLSDALAQMTYEAYNRGITGMGEAINRNPGVIQQQLAPADIFSAIGGQNRDLNQAQLDEQVQKYYMGQMLPMLQGSQLLSMIQGMPGGTTVSSGTATGAVPQTNWLQSLLGTGLAGSGILKNLGITGSGIAGGLSSLGGGIASGLGSLAQLFPFL